MDFLPERGEDIVIGRERVVTMMRRMGIEALYRRPNTSKPAFGHKMHPYPLRQYFPKGTDLCMHSADELAAVAAALNARPRKTLGWRTSAEMFDRALRSDQPGVATTG